MSLRCDGCQQLKSTCTLSQIYPPHSLPLMSELLWMDLFPFPLPFFFFFPIISLFPTAKTYHLYMQNLSFP